jgi:hypothetical protein
VWLGLTLTAPSTRTPFILPPQTLKPLRALAAHMGCLAGPLLMESSLGRAPLWAYHIVSGLDILKEIGPLVFQIYLFLFYFAV